MKQNKQNICLNIIDYVVKEVECLEDVTQETLQNLRIEKFKRIAGKDKYEELIKKTSDHLGVEEEIAEQLILKVIGEGTIGLAENLKSKGEINEKD